MNNTIVFFGLIFKNATWGGGGGGGRLRRVLQTWAPRNVKPYIKIVLFILYFIYLLLVCCVLCVVVVVLFPMYYFVLD